MQLLASWKQSLSIFYPLNNLKLFGFAVLRAMQVAVPQFFKTFWWLVLLLMVADFLKLPIDFFVVSLLLVVTYLVVRPSVGLKERSYWLERWPHILGSFVLVAGAMVATFFVQSVGDSLHPITTVLTVLFVLVDFLLPLWLFFYFDSRATIVDFFLAGKRAVMMAWYTLPAWLFLYFTLEILFLLPSLLGREQIVASLLMGITLVIVQIVVACFWSVFYTKRLHEQFELYFPRPQIKE